MGGKLADVLRRNLNIYLRERMDFIAAISTLDPTWVLPLDIVSDIVDPVWGPEKDTCPRLFLLLDNIARSEGVRAGGLELNVKISVKDEHGESRAEELQYGFSIDGQGKPRYKLTTRSYDVDNPPLHKMAVYLGTTGLQAFYGLLENFIRNSAKHSSGKDSVQERSEAIIDCYRGRAGAESGEEAARIEAERRKKAIDDNPPLRIFLDFDFDWDDKGRGVNEDFIKVNLYDNMGGWDGDRRDITKEISFKLNPLQEGCFINELGQIAEGAWGLKEMRICTSFLRGLKIQDYDSTQTEGLINEGTQVVPIIQAKPFDNSRQAGEYSLGYEFYLPKIKDLLVITDLLPKTINRSDLRNQGIYTIKDASLLEQLQSRGTFTHTFVVIDADVPENLSNFLHIAQLNVEKHNIKQYPMRTFLVTSNEDMIMREIRKLTPVDLYRPFLKNIVNKEDFNRWLAEDSIRLQTDNQEYTIGPFTLPERLILNLYRRWVEILNSDQELPKVGIGSYLFKAASLDDAISLGFSDGSRIRSMDRKVILSHKHDGFKIGNNQLNEQAIRRFRFYTSYTSSPSDELTTHANLISSPAIDYTKTRSYFELLEAALANVIVIDERIFDDARRKGGFPGLDMHLFSYLYLQNILVLNITRQKESESEKQKVLLQYYNLPQSIASSEGLKGVSSTDLSQFEKKIETAFPDFPRKIHFLIIHQTILDKLNERKVVDRSDGEKGIQQLFKAMGRYSEHTWVVVTSGRGKPESYKIPSFARFVEFSNIRKYLVEKPDKIMLMQMLYSLKEG